MKERITYFDFLRGVAILMVIGIHSYYVVPFDSLGNMLRNSMREMINCAVPLFLAISGYFIGKKQINTIYDYYAFIKKQVPRVYIPLLLWSTPSVILWILSGKIWLLAILQGMICAAFGPYYFILLIIQLYFLHPLIVRAVNCRMGGAILVMINILAFIPFNIVLTKYELPFVFLVSPFIYWITFYYIGVYFSQNSRDYSVHMPFYLIVVGAIAQLFFCYYAKAQDLNSSGEIFIGYLHSLSAWSYGLGVILLLFNNKLERTYNKHAEKLQLIRKIGVYAFGIYLFHVHVQQFIEDYTSVDSWLVKWILMTGISVAVIWMLGALLPKKAQLYLGVK